MCVCVHMHHTYHPQVPPTTSSTQPATSEHPPALRNFVMRFFARGNVTEAEKDALKKLISDAKDKGELWTRDWDNTPLPTVNNIPKGTHIPTVTAMPTTRPQVTLRAQGPKGGPLGGAGSIGVVANVGVAAKVQGSKAPVAAAKQRAQQIAASLSAQVARKRQHLDLGEEGLQKKQQKRNKKHKQPQLRVQLTSSSDDDEQQVEETLDPKELERRRRRAGRFGDGATEDFATNKAKVKRAAVVDQARYGICVVYHQTFVCMYVTLLYHMMCFFPM